MWRQLNITTYAFILQVDPKFLRNMRFAKKHNKKGLKGGQKGEKPQSVRTVLPFGVTSL